MLYNKDLFANIPNHPYFYSNFVTSIDGKAQILERTNEYWPLGSKTDYETLIELRTYADVLIHGSNTVLFHPTINSLSKDSFHEERVKNGKTEPFLYVAMSNHPSSELAEKLTSEHDQVKTMLITSEAATVPQELQAVTEVVSLGKDAIDLSLFPEFFRKRNKQLILAEGGPNVLGSFFEHHLIDELFVTIAPKIIGNEKGKTLTMVEGFLFPPDKVPSCTILSCKQIENELYLRYKVVQ